MNQKYPRSGGFDALIGISGKKFRINNNRSVLNYYFQDGRPEPVSQIKAIGTGSPYGSIFLKQNWERNNSLRMEQVAELGYLIIRYIETFELDQTFELDLTVGLNELHPLLNYSHLDIYPVYFLRAKGKVFVFVFPKFNFYEKGIILNHSEQMKPQHVFVVTLDH